MDFEKLRTNLQSFLRTVFYYLHVLIEIFEIEKRELKILLLKEC